MSNQLGLTLVQTRQKLQPFLDQGVVYKDRKIVKIDDNGDEKKNADIEERIVLYREKILHSIENKKMFELETILNELAITLDDNIDNINIYKELRMSIVHGQICLAAFFKWKKE